MFFPHFFAFNLLLLLLLFERERFGILDNQRKRPGHAAEPLLPGRWIYMITIRFELSSGQSRPIAGREMVWKASRTEVRLHSTQNEQRYIISRPFFSSFVFCGRCYVLIWRVCEQIDGRSLRFGEAGLPLLCSCDNGQVLNHNCFQNFGVESHSAIISCEDVRRRINSTRHQWHQEYIRIPFQCSAQEWHNRSTVVISWLTWPRSSWRAGGQRHHQITVCIRYSTSATQTLVVCMNRMQQRITESKHMK